MSGHRVEVLAWGQSAGELEAAASRGAAITGTEDPTKAHRIRALMGDVRRRVMDDADPEHGSHPARSQGSC